MKKILATAAALSLMLIACGDDSSSTAPDLSAGSESSSSAEVAESSSAEKLSSTGAPESSSSVALPVESIGAGETRFVGNEEEIPPMAYRYVGTERTGFTIENLSLTCGVVVDTLDVDVSGDTVYVNAFFDFTNAQRCICNSKVDFAVENNEAYWRATVLVFNNGADSNPNIMEIVDMDVISIEEVTGHKQAKDIKLECKNDRQTANAPALASNTLLPVKVDTTEKASVAGRRVGDDGFDTIIIPEVMMSCGFVFESFDVYADNGTLYVKPKVDPDSPITNCICPTRVSFRIEQNEAFSNTHYLVFDGGKPMPLVKAILVDASDLDG